MVRRIVKFEQYGTFYIAQVFDVYSEKYYYVVYSVYDMIDYFNNNSKQTVPYIKLYETLEDIDYKIHKVQHPLDYEGEASALNEKTKYIADFGKDKVEFYVSLQVSCASSNYVKIDSTAMQKNVCGKKSGKNAAGCQSDADHSPFRKRKSGCCLPAPCLDE